MRFIDADSIRGCAKYIKTNEKFEPYIMIDDLVKLLDEQPTAYDVDKVVEQLEEFRDEMKMFGCDGLLSDLIEVVEGGGVDASGI